MATLLLLADRSAAPKASTIQSIVQAGELRAATLVSATTYDVGPEGPRGFEYELLDGFARQLGVKLSISTPSSIDDIYRLVRDGDVQLGAAHLPADTAREPDIDYGQAYLTIDRFVVYRRGSYRPRDMADLAGLEVHFRTGRAIEAQFEPLAAEHPDLDWVPHRGLSGESLVRMLAAGIIDYAVVNSSTLRLTQPRYPEVNVAFEIGDGVPVAWAFSSAADKSLQTAIATYLDGLNASGEFERIWDRYYGHYGDFDYVDWRTFQRRYAGRLPAYRQAFEESARQTQLDWRLLAAMGYQESHWSPSAESATGVRGLMMLTEVTASSLGVDREDPHESIAGGARYLAKMLEQIPASVPEPDRTWMALAAYNVGLGHLEDARLLAERNGLDPNRWIDVETQLPLLRESRWHKTTRHGYARGAETVNYVNSVRRYFDVLVWLEAADGPGDSTQLAYFVRPSSTSVRP